MKKLFFGIILILLTFVASFASCVLLDYAMAEDYERYVFESDNSLSRSIPSSLPDDGIVLDNLLTNVDYSTYTSSSIGGYTRYGGTDYSISRSNDVLSIVDNNSSGYLDFAYIFQGGYNSYLNQTLTYTICIIYDGQPLVCSVTGTVTSNFSVNADLVPDGTNRRSRLFIENRNNTFKVWFRVLPQATTQLVYTKLEVSSSFTGFVPNDYTNYGYTQGYQGGYSEGYSVGQSFGYDEGYADGYIDGTEAYARHVLTIAYNGVETQDRSNIGYSDFGVSIDDLPNTFFSLESFWFDDRGYVVVSKGQFYTDTNTVNPGVAIYISTGLVTDDDIRDDIDSIDSPTCVVVLYEHYSLFMMIGDTIFPSAGTWNPVAYPRAKVVKVTGQLGFDAWQDSIDEAVRAQGYYEGYRDGRSFGFDDGYNRGFSYGIQLRDNGDWRSMLSALIGVPISYIVGFFDFEIFGFNFLSVFKTILILSIFVFVLRFMLGKVKV